MSRACREVQLKHSSGEAVVPLAVEHTLFDPVVEARPSQPRDTPEGVVRWLVDIRGPRQGIPTVTTDVYETLRESKTALKDRLGNPPQEMGLQSPIAHVGPRQEDQDFRKRIRAQSEEQGLDPCAFNNTSFQM